MSEYTMKFNEADEALSAINGESYWNVLDQFSGALLEAIDDADDESLKVLIHVKGLFVKALLEHQVMIPEMFESTKD